MRLVFTGTPQTAVPSLEALLASRHDVVAVLTRPDAPAGRGRKVEASPVASPRQNGEFADSPSRIGTCTRIPLATWIAFSGSSTATCTCIPKISS